MRVLSAGQRLLGIIRLSLLVSVMLTVLGLYALSAAKDSLICIFRPHASCRAVGANIQCTA